MTNIRTDPSADISVVMPVYNCVDYVAEAIRSIQAQTWRDLEFIIVDDGSTDGTRELLSDFARQDARIRLFFLDHGGGPRAANFGIQQASGDYIARMDADDIALPQRLETQRCWMEASQLDLCGSLAATIGDRQDIFWFPEDHEAIARELFFRVGLLHPTVMMRAAVLRANRYDESAEHDDYELWTRLAARYRMRNIQQVLLQHRCHDQQAHVARSRRFRLDKQKFRFRYFYERFPKTPLTDYLALARISDAEPMTSLAELRLAGEWLVDLAQYPDERLRRRMARRWRETCERSATLGDECQAVYRTYLARFEVADSDDDARRPV